MYINEFWVWVIITHFSFTLAAWLIILFGFIDDRFWSFEDIFMAFGLSWVPLYNILYVFGNLWYAVPYFINKYKFRKEVTK